MRCASYTAYPQATLSTHPLTPPYHAGTHKWTEADGVMIFNKSVLPGYSALFRHYNDDVYLGTYILPGA